MIWVDRALQGEVKEDHIPRRNTSRVILLAYILGTVTPLSIALKESELCEGVLDFCADQLQSHRSPWWK